MSFSGVDVERVVQDLDAEMFFEGGFDLLNARITEFKYLPIVEDDVIMLSRRVARLVLALLSKTVLADKARLEQQFNRVVQGGSAHFCPAFLHAVQQRIDVEVTPRRINFLENRKPLRCFAVSPFGKEVLQALAHFNEQGWCCRFSHGVFCTKPRIPARNR